MPIKLGSYIHIDMTADGSFSGSSAINQTGLDEMGTFTLEELDGTPVDSVLVTVLEPGTFGLLSFPFILVAMGPVVRRNGRFSGAALTAASKRAF